MRGPQPDHWVDRPDVEDRTKDCRSRPVLIGRQLTPPPHPPKKGCGIMIMLRVHYVVPNQQPGNKTHNQITTHVASCNHKDFPPPHTRAGGAGKRVTAVIAWGKRPVPFRTRKLRPTAPMVLHPGGCGTVGHRRTTIQPQAPTPRRGLSHLTHNIRTRKRLSTPQWRVC